MTVRSTPTKSTNNHALVVYRIVDPIAPTSRILATAPAVRSKTKAIFVNDDNGDNRQLCSDRQGPLAHLRPKQMVVSTIRVIMKQAAEVLAHFLSQKLEQESEMDDLIDRGKLTIREADLKTEQWEEREWNLILKTFPHKAWSALWKFHAATLLCRFYEAIADVLFENNMVIMDKLTLDVFKGGKRTSQAHPKEPAVVAKNMFVSCLWANAILYLADFSVHEIILTVGYYRMKRMKRRRDVKSTTSMEEEEKEEKVPTNTTSLAKQSADLVVSRTIGWVAASAGGAVGTVIYPGWGTLLGVNMGDSVVASVLEE